MNSQYFSRACDVISRLLEGLKVWLLLYLVIVPVDSSTTLTFQLGGDIGESRGAAYKLLYGAYASAASRVARSISCS